MCGSCGSVSYIPGKGNTASQTAGGSKCSALGDVVTVATAALVTAISLLSFVSQKELAVSQQ